MLTSTLLALAAASVTSAHFVLQWPPTAGFDDDAEPTAPCGGASVVVNSSAPHVQVDRFAVSIFSSHPMGDWGFLGTTDTAEPYNFTEIVPVVTTTGTGAFCLTEMKVPSEWAGKSGVIQVMDNSVDGVLYQCAPVQFVTGSNSTAGSACTNATGFTAAWTTQESLNNTSSTPTGTTSLQSGSGAASTQAASSTSSGAAAMFTGVGGVVGLGLLAAGLAL